jgi:hypothetical protein
LAQIFKQRTNRIPLYLMAGLALLIVGIIGGLWYFGSPRFTDVGYRPQQPVPYSHKLHAGDLGIDCRYCHNLAEVSTHANVPPTQTCMNCHKLILPESSKLLPVRESWATNVPIAWERVHQLPDYAYFNHSAHLAAGVGCSTCHGNIAEMEVVQQAQPLSMGWCLDCHRHPDDALRPREELTSMTWKPGADQARFAAQVRKDKKLNPPLDCSGCHR